MIGKEVEMQFKQWLTETVLAPSPISQDKLKALHTFITLKNVPVLLTLNLYGGRLEMGFQQTPKESTTSLDVNKKLIYPEEEFEYNPVVVNLLIQLHKTHWFDDYNVVTKQQTIPFPELIKKIKNVTGMFPTFANLKYDHKSVVKPFGIRVFKELTERPWYHTTFKRHLKKIFKQGLKPSMTFDDILDKYGDGSGGISLGKIPKKGWSSGANFQRQRAVYMYMDKEKAINLAKYLAYRNQEPTAVLEIQGKALQDYSKLTPDEDTFRDPMDGMVNKFGRSSFPHFYHSVLGMRTIAYKGIIHPRFISVVEKIEPEQIDEEDY
jgi:hypothetical protein